MWQGDVPLQGTVANNVISYQITLRKIIFHSITLHLLILCYMISNQIALHQITLPRTIYQNKSNTIKLHPTASQ